MKEVYYVYNNEALASCIFLSILDEIERLDIARCCLVLPLLLDDRIVSYLEKNFSSEISLEDVISQQPRLFASFNKRYLSLLPVTINSLMILYKSGQIKIQDDIVLRNSLHFDNSNLGERFSKINNTIPAFMSLLENYSTSNLYKILKVQL